MQSESGLLSFWKLNSRPDEGDNELGGNDTWSRRRRERRCFYRLRRIWKQSKTKKGDVDTMSSTSGPNSRSRGRNFFSLSVVADDVRPETRDREMNEVKVMQKRKG